MKPRFDNNGLNILYYALFYGSVIATAIALVAYKKGILSLAAVVAIGAVLVFMTIFHCGWIYFWNKENKQLIEEDAAGDDTTTSGIDINEAKAATTPKRLFLGLLTVLILLISWGWAWSQHVFDGVFFMDTPCSTYIWATLFSLGMLLAAFFPFLQDEDRFKNKTHLDLSISRKLTYGIFIALGLMCYSFLKDIPDGTPWRTISVLVLIYIWISFFIYYQDRISNVRKAEDAVSDSRGNHDVPELKAHRTIVWAIVEIFILILLAVAWYIKLSAEGLSLTSIFQSPLTTLIFTLLAIAWLVVAYHPVWFFSKIKESVTDKQISSFVNTGRCWAVFHAMLAVLSSLYDYLHYEESNRIIVIGTVIMFGVISWFFGGLDKHKEKKSK